MSPPLDPLGSRILPLYSPASLPAATTIQLVMSTMSTMSTMPTLPTLPTLPLRQPSLDGPSEHTVLCDSDGVFDSNQHPSQLSKSSFSGDISQSLPERYNPGPIGRCSLQMQVSPAGSVNGPTNTMVFGAEDARFGHISPPAFATRNYSSIADTGYRKCMSSQYLRMSAHHLSLSPLCLPLHHRIISSAQPSLSTSPTPPSACCYYYYYYYYSSQ